MTEPSDSPIMRNDHGGVIVGYFTKVAVVLAVFAVVCIDAVSIGVARIGVEDTAKGAARVAAEAWQETKNVNIAYRKAVEYADEHDATLDRESFSVDEKGVVTVSVSKEAPTLLVFRIKQTAKWAQVSATGTGRTV